MKIEIRDITPEEAEPYAAALQRTVRPLADLPEVARRMAGTELLHMSAMAGF